MKLASLKSTLALAAALALVAPSALQAQTATIQATATVLQPITVNGGANLDFGSVFPGTSVSVLPSDATAGTFDMNGAANAEVQVGFTLPTTLDFGANSIGIGFAVTDGLWNTANTPAGATPFDPGTGFTERLDGVTGNLFVFLGATVTAGGAVPAGNYVGDITITAAYTGN